MNSFVKLSFIPVILFTLTSCTKCDMKSLKKTRMLMDTVCEITVVSHDSQLNEKVVDIAFKEIERIDKLCGYSKESEVTKINCKAAKIPVKANNEVVSLLSRSVEISRITDGMFDITISPIVTLWGFETPKNRVPTKSEIEKSIKLVNYNNIRINKTDSTVYFTKPGMKIDLGGIAKGYAVKTTMDIIKNMGIKNSMVNLGGDIEVSGNRDGKNLPWRIGVQHPRKPDQLVTILEYNNKSVVTSGDYERCFFFDGKRYHHIMNPETGYPADNGCISVTIIAEDNVLADGLSTGIFVLGHEKGIKLVESLKNVEAIIITETATGTKIVLSKGIKAQALEYNY